MEISIDTSTRFASVGLSQEGETLAELTWRAERNHSVELVPAIREVMARCQVDMSQLEAVFVAKGPGGFSALRVGVSTAKAVASALRLPLVSIVTLDLEAQPYLGLGVPVYAVLDAGRDRVYLGTYGNVDRPTYEVVDHATLAPSVERDGLFCGEGAAETVAILHGLLDFEPRMVDAARPTRRSSTLARLGFRAWRSGRCDDPDTLQPEYLRSAQIDMAHQTWSKKSTA